MPAWNGFSGGAKTILRAVAVPAQVGTLTYTGEAQSPVLDLYDSDQMTLGGVTSGTNAGNYGLKLTPKAGFCWEDGTQAAKSSSWSIAKAAGSLTLSSTSVTLYDPYATSRTVTVTRAGDGAITATSSNTSVATVSVSGTTVTIKSVNSTSGRATITVKVAEGTNYLAPANKTIAVLASFEKGAYQVLSVSGASYGFALNSSGYYESQNKGVHSSAALCVVNFTIVTACTVTFTCINYAESNYDFGLLSNIDTTLSTSDTADSSNVYKSFKGSSSASEQTVTYSMPAGSHSIYVKFRKDSSASSNNDSLQFKVSIS